MQRFQPTDNDYSLCTKTNLKKFILLSSAIHSFEQIFDPAIKQCLKGDYDESK